MAMIDSVHLFSNEMRPIGELSVHAGTLETCVMNLEINGEHSLSIDTTVQLSAGTRALTRDPSGRWREWVVDEVEQEHSSTEYGTCSYHLVWSLQYDLQGTNEGTIKQPGMGLEDGCDASTALSCALGGSMWSVGTVEPRTKSAVIMNYNSAWDRLNQVVRHWGGEIDDHIEVGESGIALRLVNLVEHIGDKKPWRRLEWRHDLTSISRSPDPGPYFCRVIPTGNGESIEADDGATNVSVPLTIASLVGRDYLSDESAERVFRVKKPTGDWFYPTVSVSYSTDNVNELLTLAHVDLENHTRPKVSYSGTVSQLAEAGMDIGDGVNLGDEVQIFDYGFNKDYPLATVERVVKIDWDLINSDDKKVTIGKFRQSLEKTMAGIAEAAGLDEVEALTEMDLPISEVPEYDPMTIDTPNGEFSIPPITMDPVNLNEYVDDLGSRLGDLEDLMTGITGIDYDPETGTYYDRNGDPISTGTIAGDPDSFVGNTTPTGDTTVDGATPSPSLFGGGDGWIHQIDGVTYATGTINFVTTKSSDTPSQGGGSSGKPSDKPPSGKTTKTDREQAQREHVEAMRVARQAAKNNKKKSAETTATKKEEKKKESFKVTAANIAGHYNVNYHGTDTTFNELFGKDKDDENFVDPGSFIWDGLKDLFGVKQ